MQRVSRVRANGVQLGPGRRSRRCSPTTAPAHAGQLLEVFEVLAIPGA